MSRGSAFVGMALIDNSYKPLEGFDSRKLIAKSLLMDKQNKTLHSIRLLCDIPVALNGLNSFLSEEHFLVLNSNGRVCGHCHRSQRGAQNISNS